MIFFYLYKLYDSCKQFNRFSQTQTCKMSKLNPIIYYLHVSYINLHKSLFNVFSSLIFSNSVISNPKLQYIAKYIKTKTIPTKLNYVGKKVRFCCHPEEKRVYKVGDRGGYIR